MAMNADNTNTQPAAQNGGSALAGLLSMKTVTVNGTPVEVLTWVNWVAMNSNHYTCVTVAYIGIA
jgi:hypothetical protein